MNVWDNVLYYAITSQRKLIYLRINIVTRLQKDGHIMKTRPPKNSKHIKSDGPGLLTPSEQKSLRVEMKESAKRLRAKADIEITPISNSELS